MCNALEAYGKVVMKRFFDEIPMICLEIIHTFYDSFGDKFLAIADDELDKLMVEKEHYKVQYDQLLAEVAELRAVQKELDSLLF
jgi:hypothetical protein